MRALWGAAFLSVLAFAGPALSCDPQAFSAEDLALVEPDVASTLVREAASVEIAVVERARALGRPKRVPAPPGSFEALQQEIAEAETDPAFLGIDSYAQWFGRRRSEVKIERAAIRFRVVERLKGAGSTAFDLQGFAVRVSGGLNASDAPRFVEGDYSTAKRVWDAPPFRTLDVESSDCDVTLTAVIGARYLVFRDREGRLLDATVPIRARGDETRVRGPVFETVPRADDPWLARVRKAVAAPAGR